MKKVADKKAKDDKENITTKKVLVEAASKEELIWKINQIDWSEPQAGRQQIIGSKFDYSI